MQSSRHSKWTAALFCLSLSLAAAQMTPSTTVRKRIGTVTRQVAEFSDLEREFASALEKKDQPKLAAMLADDFTFWSPAGAGDPINRDEWLENSRTVYQVHSWSLRELNVKLEGDLAFVNFTAGEKSRFRGRDASGDYFVVDVWTKLDAGWQLTARYASRIQKLPPARPSGKG